MIKFHRRFAPSMLLIAITMLLAGTGSAKAAPDAELWPRWQAHDPDAVANVDHQAWAGLLTRYLVTDTDGINRFAYGTVTADDRKRLNDYVAMLAETPISSHNRATQMAYWINLYNALTVNVILDHYPTKSIRDIDISPGFFSDGPWGKKLVTIEGEDIALDDIEHQILRPIWQDPRIHYAVNCASIGCPNLQPEPFEASSLDRQLDQAAIDFVNHKRGVSIDNGRVTISSIYRWFREDFGSSDQAVLAHLKAYAAPILAMRLDGLTRIHDDDYDWRLNDALKGS